MSSKEIRYLTRSLKHSALPSLCITTCLLMLLAWCPELSSNLGVEISSSLRCGGEAQGAPYHTLRLHCRLHLSFSQCVFKHSQVHTTGLWATEIQISIVLRRLILHIMLQNVQWIHDQEPYFLISKPPSKFSQV